LKKALLFGLFLVISRIWLGLTVPPEKMTWVSAYKDMAHLFMGGLYWANRSEKKPWQFRLFWFLVAVEVAVATLSRI